MELYKKITDYDNYEVSNIGNIRNIKTGKILKSRLNNTGYLCVSLGNKNHRKNFSIHRLVGESFIPNPYNKQVIDHINGIRNDNRIENLRWATLSENSFNRKMSPKNKIGDRGISFCKISNFYIPIIEHKGKRYRLGYFSHIEDAVNARRLKAKELFGEYVNECEKELIPIDISKDNKKRIKIQLKQSDEEYKQLEREFEELIK